MGGFVVLLAQQHLVHLADELLGEGPGIVHHFFKAEDGFVVAFDVEVVAQGLAFGGEGVQQQRVGFAQREGVALDGIGMVVLVEPKLLQHPLLLLRGQRPEDVEVGFKAVEDGEKGHGAGL